MSTQKMNKETAKTTVALVSLNAKFIHSNLAIDYLRASIKQKQVPVAIEVMEFHINQPVDHIVGELLQSDINILGFSCYIWNITETLHVIRRLKLANPSITVIIGGPEVSYDAEKLLNEYPEIDYCIIGQGEASFPKLLQRLIIGGVHHKAHKQDIKKNIIMGEPVSLGEIPSPYPDNLKERYRNKLVYLETTRGCPINCQYCLSANTRGVTYFPWERVKQEFLKLMDAGFPQIKLIDRTFNANPAWALRIFHFLVEENSRRGAFEKLKPPTIFHFEISADILTDKLLEYLAHVPTGLFQFEIGIQSTTPKVLDAIARKSDWQVLQSNIKHLVKPGNIHLHLDLIAGLPYETWESFAKSFDDVYQLGGHRIQMGFLKLLKGSGLRENGEKLGLVYDPYPPYEIIKTSTMSALELVKLKEIENLLEQYHNSHRFKMTLKLLTSTAYNSPFRFFEEFAAYFRELKLHQVAHSPLALYDIVHQFINIKHASLLKLALEALKFDFLRTEPHRPLRKWMPDDLGRNHRQIRHRLLQMPKIQEQLDPRTLALPPRQMAQKVRIGRFSRDFIEVLCKEGLHGGTKTCHTCGNQDIGWIVFDHHKRNPWTSESAYTIMMEEE